VQGHVVAEVIISRSSCGICGGQSGSQYFCFPLSLPFHQCCTLIFVLMLILPEGQAGEAWEPSNKGM